MQKANVLRSLTAVVFFSWLFFSSRLSADVYSAMNTGATASNGYAGIEAAFLGDITVTGSTSFMGWLSIGSAATVSISSSATANYNCVGEFCGTLAGSGSHLIVGSDLWCGPSFAIVGGIRITSLSANQPYGIMLSGGLTLSAALQLGDGIFLDGGGNTVTLASSGYIVLDSSATVTLKNMTLCVKTTTPFYWNSNDARVALENVKVVLDPSLGGEVQLDGHGTHYGNLTISRSVSIDGAGQTFNYNSNVTNNDFSSSLLIADSSTLLIGPGVTFKLSSDFTTKNAKMYFKGSGSMLKLDNCTFALPVAGITNPGAALERGCVVFDNRVLIANESNTAAVKGLVLGDGSSASNNVAVKVHAGAQVVIDGFMDHRPA